MLDIYIQYRQIIILLPIKNHYLKKFRQTYTLGNYQVYYKANI